MSHPFTGLHYLLAGFELIAKPGLRKYALIPVLISICLFIGLFFFLNHYVYVFNSWLTAHLPTWLYWLSFIIWLLFLATFFIAFIYLFVIIINIVAAPFNSLLSEKVEFYLTKKPIVNTSIWQNIKDVPRALCRQLALFGYYLPRALLLLILFFVPIVQVFAAFLWFLFNAWFLTLSYVDYPTDRHRVSLNNVRSWLKEQQAISLGFGVSVLLFSMIPFVNFFVVPAACAGATKMWIDRRTKH